MPGPGEICSRGSVCSWGYLVPGGCLLLGVPRPVGVYSWGVHLVPGGVCSGGFLVPGVSAPGGCLVLGGAWWRPPPPGQLLLRAVCILLECILVANEFSNQVSKVMDGKFRSRNGNSSFWVDFSALVYSDKIRLMRRVILHSLLPA